MESRTILFSGRVQGVGFRATTVQLAADLPVAGTVRNLPDGRVELVVSGAAGHIDRLVARLSEHFGSFVRSIDQSVAPAAASPGRGVRIVH